MINCRSAYTSYMFFLYSSTGSFYVVMTTKRVVNAVLALAMAVFASIDCCVQKPTIATYYGGRAHLAELQLQRVSTCTVTFPGSNNVPNFSRSQTIHLLAHSFTYCEFTMFFQCASMRTCCCFSCPPFECFLKCLFYGQLQK